MYRSDKFNVVFDMDGVILDTISIISNLYFNEHYNEIMEGTIPLGLHYMTKKWNMNDEFPMMSVADLDRYFTSDQFFLNRQYIMDSDGFSMKELMEELCMDNKFNIGICTKGSPQNLLKKRDLVLNEFKNFNMNNFHGIEGTEFGKDSVSADIMIDDVVANLVSLKDVKYRILFAARGVLDCEWNENYKDYPDIIVCTSVRELCNKIIELYEFEKAR